MLNVIVRNPDQGQHNIILLEMSKLDAWLTGQSEAVKQWVAAAKFEAGRGKFLRLADSSGAPGDCLLGLGSQPSVDVWTFGDLARGLTQGRFRISDELDAAQATRAVLGWSLGSYRFDRYKSGDDSRAELVAPANADLDLAAAAMTGICLARDLINTPAGDMGPSALADAARSLATSHGGDCHEIIGPALLEEDYPAIHAVGRASPDQPRLIDFNWGDSAHPKVTLVGKGVCFDTGGLDLKPSVGMLKMKKDMGGAATVLGLANMIMATKLPLRLRVLIPAVENSVAGNAYRPGDVLQTRKGLTVEVGNTDAEGRIVLCDALAEADRQDPDMILDFATLTGAARVALGTDLPALFCNDDALADELLEAGLELNDPMWRLPLHAGYREMLDSKIADLNNVSAGGFGGAITAALYLNEFVSETTSWAHIDTYGWNDNARPGRTVGGHPMGMLAAYATLRRRYL